MGGKKDLSQDIIGGTEFLSLDLWLHPELKPSDSLAVEQEVGGRFVEKYRLKQQLRNFSGSNLELPVACFKE